VNDELAQELARMALDLHEQPAVEQTAERFLDYVRAAIRISHAGVVLVHRGGRLKSAAATDPLAAAADRLQLEAGEGPVYAAVNNQRPDPAWAEMSGFRSVLSVGLRTPTSTVGALTLYDEAPDRFTARDAARSQLYADHAAIAIASARTESTLWEAIETRKLIGQAQGILMERFELTGEQSFAVLRRYSQDSNVKLRDVAQKLITSRNLGENL
jgi:transcriptional regulator with GAF, ATPase, and Fis domain